MKVDEKAVDAACAAWKKATDLLFTRREKVVCVIEAYEAAKSDDQPNNGGASAYDGETLGAYTAVIAGESPAAPTTNQPDERTLSEKIDDVEKRLLEQQGDDKFKKLFFIVARTLKCLPSSFADDNGHVLLAAEKVMMRESIAPSGFTLVPDSALAWLFGEEGSFNKPVDAKGNYWWRSRFRKMIEQGRRGSDDVD